VLLVVFGFVNAQRTITYYSPMGIIVCINLESRKDCWLALREKRLDIDMGDLSFIALKM
jgi:hypothetical protein